ncbi:MAG: hypothetical protein J6Q10_01810 [Clostridia bacterium]|nr:hypothetical protein [Clostridia bacterium]
MTNTNIDKYIPEPDYSTTKSVIRSISGSLSDHLERFRLISAIGHDTKALKLNFTHLYSSLMNARLDIPKPLFKELKDFASNYLQQLAYYLDCIYFMGEEDVDIDSAEEFIDTYANTYTFEPCAPWLARGKWVYVFIDADNKFCKAFEQAIAEQIKYQEDSEVIPAGDNEIIIAAAYQYLEEILSEYMVG